jgi:hypothetical protein
LYDYFSKFHPKVLFNDLSVDPTTYLQKTDFTIHQPVRLFWTGSRINAQINLSGIMSTLEELNAIRPLKLVMVCATRADFSQNFIEHYLWTPDIANKLLADVDIALYPAMEDNDYSRGKVAFKTLEYAVAKAPMVASSQGLSSHFKDGEDVLIANDLVKWKQQLLRLMDDEVLRKRLADSAYEKLLRYHTVQATYKNFLYFLNA